MDDDATGASADSLAHRARLSMLEAAACRRCAEHMAESAASMAWDGDLELQGDISVEGGLDMQPDNARNGARIREGATVSATGPVRVRSSSGSADDQMNDGTTES